MSESLWGELPSGAGIRTPHSILLEQAEALTKKSDGILVGRAKRGHSILRDFESTLEIVVPSLNNYTFKVVTLEYDVTLYPADIETQGRSTPTIRADNEDELKTALRAVLTSDYVRNAIAGLLAQVRADADLQ